MNAIFDATNTVGAVSIGFGPAAIALACSIEDARENDAPAGHLDVRYLEKAGSTSWHPELLVDGTDINHSPFRDLVTPRNPRSRFSFAMYLKEKGRIFDFGLLGRPASRMEWSDYISWTAGHFLDNVNYDTDVREVLPVVIDGTLDHVKVQTDDGEIATRNLILSSGSYPSVPEEILPHLGDTVFHTSEFLSRLKDFGATPPIRWLVVGSGQSASECVLELLSRLPDVEVTSVHRRSIGFRLTQLGHFPNQVFSPSHVDYFYDLNNDQRREYLRNSRSANYAGVDPDESQKLFSIVYEDKLHDQERLKVVGYHVIDHITPKNDGYDVVLRDTFTNELSHHEVDAVLLATGYEQYLVPPLLANIQPWLVTDDDGGLLVARDYSVEMAPNSKVKIFANGLSERSHGLSDGQSFSHMALRAEQIVQGLMA